MTRFGLRVALRHALGLPMFSSLAEARKALLAEKEAALIEIERTLETLNYEPESLNLLEKWFFTSEKPIRTKQDIPISLCIGFYLGEVFCRSAGFTWVVKESPFKPGHFEIGVTKGLLTLMLTNGWEPNIQKNAKMQSMLREFRRYTAQPSTPADGLRPPLS